MKLYNKYLIKNMLLPFLLITVTFTSVAWLVRSLRFIDFIVNRGLDLFTFLFLSSLVIPAILMIILPVACFCAVIFSYNRMINESEIMVLQAAGLSKFSLSKPAIIVAIMVTLIGYSISMYFLPKSYKEFKDTQRFLRDNYISSLLQEGVFNSVDDKGRTIYFEERTGSEGLLKGILFYDVDKDGSAKTYMAESGKLVKTDSGPAIILINGNVNEIDKKTKNLTIGHFSSLKIDLDSYTKTSVVRKAEVEERSIFELLNKNSNRINASYLVEGHHRIIWPLYNLVLALIGLVFIMSGQFNRRGQWQKIAIAGGVATFVVSVDLGLKAMATKNIEWIFLMYSNVALIFLVCCYFLLSKKQVRNRI